jgi:hypothetical protein
VQLSTALKSFRQRRSLTNPANGAKDLAEEAIEEGYYVHVLGLSGGDYLHRCITPCISTSERKQERILEKTVY